jgi:hypothetical protein
MPVRQIERHRAGRTAGCARRCWVRTTACCRPRVWCWVSPRGHGHCAGNKAGIPAIITLLWPPFACIGAVARPFWRVVER